MAMNDTMSASAVLGANFVAALTDPCATMASRMLPRAWLTSHVTITESPTV